MTQNTHKVNIHMKNKKSWARLKLIQYSSTNQRELDY